MILILTESDDSHAEYVEHILRQRHTEYVRFNPAEFPSKAKISLSCSAMGQLLGMLNTGDQVIDLNLLQAIWWRRPQSPVPHQKITDKLIYDYIGDECKAYLNGIWDSLDCLWLPAPPSIIRRAEYKPLQLKIAAAVGFELPPTLFTNNPGEFLEFYFQHNGNIISKL